jgi:hypothetical protein
MIRVLGRGLRIALILALMPWLGGLFPAACASHRTTGLSSRGLSRYAWARAHLEAPFVGYGVIDDLGVDDFDVVILSNLASGLMNVSVLEPARTTELRSLIAEVARRAIAAEVSPRGVVATRMSFGDHNLYASHLLLILGIEHRLGLSEHDALAQRLAVHLRRKSLEFPHAHARSYPGSARWPADQSVTLAALYLHDREHRTGHSTLPVARWLTWISQHQTRSLPWSAVGGVSYARIPRGCALSFMTNYMAVFAPEASARFYANYRRERAIGAFGWSGFREWPRGHSGRSDVDAGPVLFGWGTAATGIGLGAARLHGDAAQFAGIERIADTVGARIPFGTRYLLAPTVGEAMLFSGETATFWFERPATRSATSSEWPIGSQVLLTLVVALVIALLRGVFRSAPQQALQPVAVAVSPNRRLR